MEQKDKAMWVQTLWEPLEEMNQSPLHSKREGIRVAAYCRVSKSANNMKSLENQISYYSKYIYNQPNWKFVGVYIDDQKSGATIKHRPGFKRMMRHAKEGKIDLILTKNISRFSRNTKELLDAVEELKESGSVVWFEREQIETSKGMNNLLLKTHGAMAQDYLESSSNQLKFAYQKRLNEARPYYQPMYGYDLISNTDRSRVIINEKEAEVVRWIFNQFIQGVSYSEISRQLVKRGVETKNGNKHWGLCMVRKIINNIAYTGNKHVLKRTKDLLTGKMITHHTTETQQIIMNNHPAIISIELFNKAQERVKRPIKEVKVNRHGKIIKEEKSLKKRLICGRCGRWMWKKGYYKYGCSNARSHVKLCDLEVLPIEYLLEIGVKALFQRMMDIGIGLYTDKDKRYFKIQEDKRSQTEIDNDFQKMISDLEKILRKINQNDHFEFGRLKIFSALEIARIQNDTQKIQVLEREYKEFEEKVSCIEEDRTYRDEALAWIQTVRSINEFIEGMTIERLRAWMVSMRIYSRSVYTVNWVDEQITTIGEERIPSIIKEVEEKRKTREKSIQEQGGISLTEITREVEINDPHQSVQNKGDTILEITTKKHKERTKVVGKEVVKLEHGLGIRELNNLKCNIIKNKMVQLEQEKKKKLKVAAYCRVSTHLDEQKVSLQTQLAFYSYKILSNPEWELAGIYVDEGISGTKLAKRDDFNHMLEDARQGKIDMIITKSISRFSRNVVDTLQTIKMLHGLNPPCIVYFQSEGLRSNDPNAPVLLSIMASTAQEEVTSLSSSLAWGLKSLAQRGIVTRRVDPYGYKIDKHRQWHVIEEEAKIVREMYWMYASGKTVYDIARWLKAEGIKSPSGSSKWGEQTVRFILRSEKYIGDYEYQKRYTPDVVGSKPKANRGQVPKYYIEQHHLPIVDQELYDRVQKIFDERKKAPIEDKRKDGTAGRESYYKKFTCAECGNLISRFRSNNRYTKEGNSWRCKNSYDTVHSLCEVKSGTLERYMDYHFVETLKHIKVDQSFRRQINTYLRTLELDSKEWIEKKQLEKQMDELNQKLYEAVDAQIQKNGKDANLINQITNAIIQLREEHDIYLERIEKRAYEQERLEKLIQYCKEMEAISFKDFHNMNPRIKDGDSIYDTPNNKKHSTYMNINGKDYFPEKVFKEQVISGVLDKEGRITYKFAEGLEFGAPIIYKDYTDMFNEEIAKINFEELVNSKEALMIRKHCKSAKHYKEIRDCTGVLSDTSFRQRILDPLCQRGKIQIEEGSSKRKLKYYWNE